MIYDLSDLYGLNEFLEFCKLYKVGRLHDIILYYI